MKGYNKRIDNLQEYTSMNYEGLKLFSKMEPFVYSDNNERKNL